MRRRALRLGLAAAAVWAGLAALDAAFPPDLGVYNKRSRLVLDRDGRVIGASLTPEGRWRVPIRPEAVDPLYLRMVLAFEDRRFYRHPGVDPLAVGRAVGQWIRNRRVVSGASTLSMQVARLLEPRPRTFRAKGAEVLRAFQLERRLGKREILSIYLTLTPFGGNLEGVRAASLAYFGKGPGRLTPAEAALLVSIPQSPSRLRPNRHPRRARAARNKVLARMARAGVIAPGVAARAMEDPVPARRLPFRKAAPLLVRRLLTGPGGGGGGAESRRTFIDLRLQRAVRRLARGAATRWGPSVSAAVLVVENKGRKVAAYVGSADFFDDGRQGRVDMVNRRRSPGSTLKPFIYGVAMDEGIIHPETLIRDERLRIGDYAPRNFDGGFQGEVTVREALQHSLNVPAVLVLNRVGPARMMAEFQMAGISPRFAGLGGDPGLALALGGVGLTLEELVTLYAALADRGAALPLRLAEGRRGSGGRKAAAKPRRLLGRTAAWHLTKILEGAPRPPDRVKKSRSTPRAPIAFKTGTSYGYRDAWAIGYNKRYTAGVWVGRPDGTPVPGATGRRAAAPLLFKVFEQLPPPPPSSGVRAPEGALIADNRELPPHLRRLRVPALGERGVARDRTPPPRLEFPRNGSTVELSGAGAEMSRLPLIAHGGEGPFNWLINGRPISGGRKENEWNPDGPGFVRVTVVDAAGRSASAEIKIR
ncbi:MAG: penicillin-binding protein 1C [Nitrospinota bacterium]|nr:penicillin-binding protein 1C [Nitrospinota bacterium]